MRLWIEDDNGNRVECEEIKTVNVPDSILVFETAKKLTKSCIDDFRKCIKEQTGHECVLVDAGRYPPGSCVENRHTSGHRRPTSKHTKS